MPQYTDEEKAQRKQTIKSWNNMKLLDGGFTPTPQFDIVHHPRAYNKPFSCQAGRHTWGDKVVMGVPFLYCIKCGAGAPRDSYYGVLTEREKRANVPDPITNINKSDWITEVVERINAKSRK